MNRLHIPSLLMCIVLLSMLVAIASVGPHDPDPIWPRATQSTVLSGWQ
ncbi:hypothetical protein [Ktedonosporobacter rubrisoli]|nr:hypothetical protein [Ktedonosporobacter rubrisoli]